MIAVRQWHKQNNERVFVPSQGSNAYSLGQAQKLSGHVKHRPISKLEDVNGNHAMAAARRVYGMLSHALDSALLSGEYSAYAQINEISLCDSCHCHVMLTKCHLNVGASVQSRQRDA